MTINKFKKNSRKEAIIDYDIWQHKNTVSKNIKAIVNEVSFK
jgi:hypothetical protein